MTAHLGQLSLLHGGAAPGGVAPFAVLIGLAAFVIVLAAVVSHYQR